MSKANDLTAYALDGYNSRVRRDAHIYSSPAWYAYMLGVHMWVRDLPEPADVRMSRGTNVRVGEHVWRITDEKHNEWERIK